MVRELVVKGQKVVMAKSISMFSVVENICRVYGNTLVLSDDSCCLFGPSLPFLARVVLLVTNKPI